MPAPAPGDRLSDNLVLERELVQGGMGSVWVARHEGLGSEVAVKILSGRLVDDDTAKKRFAREAAAAMEVQSPHVVQMLDYGISNDGVPFLVMELLQGEDLEVKLAKGPLPPREVVSIVKQIGQALHRAHERNILHRDIKPANVFLVPSDEFSGDAYFVKLLDFGFAKRLDRMTAPLTEEGMIVGTPQYMSPEQMLGGKLDPRSDLFSLGSIAFEAFTGRRAFAGKTLQEVAFAIQGLQMPSPTHVNPTLPRALDAWFAKACARDRDDRFASAREMVAALEKVFAVAAEPASIEAAPEGRVLPAGRSSWSGRIALLLLLVVAATAVAIFVARAQ
ncbi:MAG: serine/threonine protein kinase [Deltaproteobacteria bacterium]|nr:serine/threonine protein kinase [Deltaproteobacteria bacterium]